MTIKKIIALLSVFVILVAGITAVKFGLEYCQTTNVEVTKNADGSFSYNKAEPDGVADKIIEANVQGISDGAEIKANNTNAVNNVAAVVFDFRGYDTLGESFILLTAIAGTFVILSKNKKKKAASDEAAIKEEVKEEA